ncbi:MAG: M15 family metallopeptidase [Halobacteriovoraceae bacterium]|nr:M15 family metallopeptidase [Halobacteriovoraceae bacterium]
MNKILAILSGKSEEHLDVHEQVYGKIHKNALSPFLSLRLAAASEGIDLQIASAFRSFDRQLKIWNEKILGLREIHDDQGKIIERENLTDRELIFKILRFSALPGLSRHHWGSEIDVFDANALPSKDYKLKLSPDEYSDNGIFSRLHFWLSERISTNKAFGFFRPYEFDHGGVSPERWHLSYYPVSKEYSKLISVKYARELIRSSEIELKDVILEELDYIFKTFINLRV